MIDIHTGGIDLRFPHHEDERAQSNALAGHEVVQHWVHGEHVLFEGRKMAKSTGNVVLLSDLADRGLDPLAARLAFLEHRYRQQMNLTWDTLIAADGTVRRWRELVADWANEPSKPMCAEYWARITTALDDDLDTPAALRALRELAKDPADPGRLQVRDIRQRRPGPRPRPGQPRRQTAGRPPPLPPGAEDMLAERAAARERKDFGASDRLRAELAQLGVAVADTPDGQTWTVSHRLVCRSVQPVISVGALPGLAAGRGRRRNRSPLRSADCATDRRRMRMRHQHMPTRRLLGFGLEDHPPRSSADPGAPDHDGDRAPRPPTRGPTSCARPSISRWSTPSTRG